MIWRYQLRRVLVAFALLLAFAVAACSSGHPSIAAPSPSPSPTSTASPIGFPESPAVPTPTVTPPAASTAPMPYPALEVAFIDVGQGDAILVDQGTTEVLIDGGPSSGSQALLSYLRGHVDGPLEAVVATHPHADHIGGLPAVLASFDVEDVWVNGETATTQAYRLFITAATEEGCPLETGYRGETLQAGDLAFKVLSPEALSDTTNENSLVLELDYGNVSFLFTGDAGADSEASTLAAGLLHQVTVLKVGHHGSRYSSSAAFLQATRPAVAVYMAGAGNSYGHPHAETLAGLAGIGGIVCGTDKNGTVVVDSDGNMYSVETAR